MDTSINEKQEKRKKLLFFASITLVILSLAALYFEILDPYPVPFVVRFLLGAYWIYSLVGIIVSRKGSDEWVTKMYLNVNR